MTNAFDPRRRRLLLGATGTLLTAAAAAAAAAAERRVTPRQSAGPFYPDEVPLDNDNDLTRIQGQIGKAKGRISDLQGRVLDLSGQPLRGVRVEIWQCDANGRYRHPGDRQTVTVDVGFQGSGHAVTDADGRYRFRTIRPVPYPGRTPHIHAAVFRPSVRPFVTQIYVAGEPGNAEDFLFRRIPVESRSLVMAEFLPSVRPGVELQAEFDFVLTS